MMLLMPFALLLATTAPLLFTLQHMHSEFSKNSRADREAADAAENISSHIASLQRLNYGFNLLRKDCAALGWIPSQKARIEAEAKVLEVAQKVLLLKTDLAVRILKSRGALHWKPSRDILHGPCGIPRNLTFEREPLVFEFHSLRAGIRIQVADHYTVPSWQFHWTRIQEKRFL